MATSDVKRFSAMLEVTELISRNVARYAVFEALYLCGTACQATNVLQEAVVDLYASILKMMSTVHVYYSQNTGGNLLGLLNILNSTLIILNLVHIAQSIFVAGNDYLLQATNDLIGKQRVIDECASMVDAERMTAFQFDLCSYINVNHRVKTLARWHFYPPRRNAINRKRLEIHFIRLGGAH